MDRKNDADFSFQKVSSDQKRKLVGDVFSDVAKKYDIMNDIMSFGVHRIWKSEFCNMIYNYDAKILDVAGGTGDIAFRIKEKAKTHGADPYIVVTDINPDMLDLCQKRAIDNNMLSNLEFVVSDAENLPFQSNSFDYYTISFGIRNVVNIDCVLKEAYRVLKPGGRFLCLEFSKVQNECLDSLYNFYSFNIIPTIGGCVANNKDAYRYLAESINLFPDQNKFKCMIEAQNFKKVGYKNLTFGIAAIHYGTKET
ncbi:MAG TPA: bifunctional demethylmenaquinone methyltransferase/2-methoxy-6-polyprenyl-1,4-benzoquinol methylase UbiE [Candidatus Megaira endosymbiont of Nemacystus decipiens]|nr:bifunctional demethylmenaquinone methyltransferase/2-methoxy-6-polyprenyl-1,4-benzoquinol methylase UbiE [Candidatus Megaera endosymbiont of Nemacystus decipiens]